MGDSHRAAAQGAQSTRLDLLCDDEEWGERLSKNPPTVKQLRAVPHQTNGRELLNLKEAWLRPPYIAVTSPNLPVGISLLLLILLDALITRTGWKLPEFGNRVKPAKLPKPIKVRAPKAVVKAPVIVEEKPKVNPDTEPAPSERRSRFQKAKDKK
jgi:hypothetical protein